MCAVRTSGTTGASPEHAVGSIGHEFIGVVEDVGADVTTVAVGDLVVAPFIFSDMSCPHCRHGSTISCARGGSFGNGTIDGGQGEAVRVPLAGSTLVPVPGSGHSDAMLRSLLTLVGRDGDRPPRRSVRRCRAGRHGRGGPRGDGYRRMIELCPAGRVGTPDEIGTLGAFLMGPDGAFITGSDFLIDGGVTAAYFYGDLQPTSPSTQTGTT